MEDSEGKKSHLWRGSLSVSPGGSGNSFKPQSYHPQLSDLSFTYSLVGLWNLNIEKMCTEILTHLAHLSSVTSSAVRTEFLSLQVRQSGLLT